MDTIHTGDYTLNSNSKVVTRAGNKTRVNAKVKACATTKASATIKTDAKAKAKAEAKAGAGATTGVNGRARAGAKADIKAKTVTNSKTKDSARTKAKRNTRAEVKSNSAKAEAKKSVRSVKKSTKYKSKDRANNTSSRARNRTYRRNELAIQKALLPGVRDRVVDCTISELCLLAEVTRPTFYAHHDSPNDAIHSYEDEVFGDFKDSLPIKSLNRDATFTLLLGNIARHRKYFSATLEGKSSYVLVEMLDLIRPRLVTGNVSDATYLIYRGNLKSIIQIWGTKDHFTRTRIPFYVKRLSQTKIVRWEEG